MQAQSLALEIDEPELMQQQMDASLVVAAERSRDGEAIAEIVRRYGELIYSVGLRMTGDATVAADVSRDCVAELAAAPHRVRGELAAWLHKTAVRVAESRVSANGQNDRDPAEEPHWEEVCRAIDPALASLGARHRQIIIQHYFQRHTQEELAEMMQVTQPVVSRRLRRALDRLRAALVERGAGCSLAHLMMLLARHGASDAPRDLVDQLALNASEQIVTTPRRARWFGIFAVWVVVAGLIIAVAASYSVTRNAAEATPAESVGESR